MEELTYQEISLDHLFKIQIKLYFKRLLVSIALLHLNSLSLSWLGYKIGIKYLVKGLIQRSEKLDMVFGQDGPSNK